MNAPTAEEQLPQLDITPEESERCGQYATVVCRERQLLAALRGNREKDARIAELEGKITRREQWLKEHSEKLDAAEHNAEAAESKLRAVSDALEEILKTATQFAYNPQIDNAVARLRAIVEGK